MPRSSTSVIANIARRLGLTGMRWDVVLREAAHAIEKSCECSTCGAGLGAQCSAAGGTDRYYSWPHTPRVEAFVVHVLPHLPAPEGSCHGQR